MSEKEGKRKSSLIPSSLLQNIPTNKPSSFQALFSFPPSLPPYLGQVGGAYHQHPFLARRHVHTVQLVQEGGEDLREGEREGER